MREERRGRKLRAAIPLPRFPPAPLPYFCDPIPTFVFTFSLTFLSASVALHAEPKRGHGDEGGGGKIRVRRIDKVQRGEARRGRYKWYVMPRNAAETRVSIYIYFIYRPREFVHASHFSNYQFFYPPRVYILLARFFPRDRARLNFEDFSKIFTFPSLVRKFNDSLRHPPSWFPFLPITLQFISPKRYTLLYLHLLHHRVGTRKNNRSSSSVLRWKLLE